MACRQNRGEGGSGREATGNKTDFFAAVVVVVSGGSQSAPDNRQIESRRFLQQRKSRETLLCRILNIAFIFLHLRPFFVIPQEERPADRAAMHWRVKKRGRGQQTDGREGRREAVTDKARAKAGEEGGRNLINGSPEGEDGGGLYYILRYTQCG